MKETLLEQVSSNGNVAAVLESSGGACYLYLHGVPEIDFAVRALWVCNLVPAPDDLDVTAMHRGEPPLNPRAYCRHPEGRRPLDPADLRVVWLPEGNGAGLYEDGELIAAIPPWSGEGGFDGYASEAVGQGPLAWELSPENAMHARFQEADAYWQSRDDPDLWRRLQTDLCRRIESALGPQSNYYAIDGGNWPPKALLRIPSGDRVFLVSIGVCIRPQPNVERYFDDPRPHRRIELGAVLPTSWDDAAIMQFAAYLSGRSNYPWNHYTWLGPGHTIPCDAWRNERFTLAALNTQHAAAPPVSLGVQFGDPVSLLWFLPITAAEQAESECTGTRIENLPGGRWTEC